MSSKLKSLISYCLYDWASSPFSTVIITFIFAAYFEKAIVGDPEKASILWGWAISLSAILVAISSPVLGKFADDKNNHRFLLILFTFLTAIGSTLLWFAYPSSELIFYTLFIVVLSNTFFELSSVFYNAQLLKYSARNKVGKLSGQAWAVGYIGGIVCLLFILYGFIQIETPLFGIEKVASENIRISGPIVGLWFIVFSIPLLISISSTKKQSPYNFKKSFRSILLDLKSIFRGNNKGKFLLSRMIYTDGLNTLFAFGGLYAAGTFNMNFAEIIIFGIIINITAGIGALLFSYLDDWIGPKKVIISSLILIIVLGSFTLMIDDKIQFYILGSSLGFFIGPVQSSSRSFMARFVSGKNNGQIFGIYALSGKITSFLGPLVLSFTVLLSDNQRIGMGSIIVFLIIGLILIIRVEEPIMKY